jgi:hypothetical protein
MITFFLRFLTVEGASVDALIIGRRRTEMRRLAVLMYQAFCSKRLLAQIREKIRYNSHNIVCGVQIKPAILNRAAGVSAVT